MPSVFSLAYVFLEKYLVPLLFAIGLFYFIYGCIEYFIIGEGGDEERAHHGRELFLKAIAWFVLAIVIHVVVSFIGWLGSASLFTPPVGTPRGGAGAEIHSNEGVLQVPNAPTR